MSKTTFENIEGFAVMINKLLKSDRDVNIAVGGFTGEGKSTFSTKLAKAYAKVAKTYWGFNRMTWERKELLKWIDGKKEKNSDKRIGQLPEYSVMVADELFKMFYKRNWFEEEQIDAIATFNMCRDRHLLLIGNIPNFWELDGGFQNRIRFYAYIPKRGIAWIFQQENNPFSSDNWNVNENKKIFRKKKSPYRCPNFICQLRFNDWDEKEKEEYYNIRNKKRIAAIEGNKPEKLERYSTIKAQRDVLLRMCFEYNKKLTNKTVAEMIGLSSEAVRLLREGLR